VLVDTTPLAVSRKVLSLLPATLEGVADDTHVLVARHALAKVAPRAVSFEEQSATIRESLADVLERQGRLSEAAIVLAGIDLDSGVRQLSEEYKLKICVRTAMLYLEDDDSVGADSFIKKASFMVDACKDEGVKLQFKVCYARILDSKRKFLEAAVRYYEISQIESGVAVVDGGGAAGAPGDGMKIDAADIKVALSCAVSCTLLAAAGPQRSRMLATLYKDERCQQLNTLYPILQKVYMERILLIADIDSFASTLKPHHLAVTADGSTVLQRAMVEHNMLSCSKVYNNIGLEELGTLLGVEGQKAERVAARMIVEGRMTGTIDQLDAMIYFSGDEMGAAVEPGKHAASENEQWDSVIADVCSGVNKIIEQMQKRGVQAAIDLAL